MFLIIHLYTWCQMSETVRILFACLLRWGVVLLKHGQGLYYAECLEPDVPYHSHLKLWRLYATDIAVIVFLRLKARGNWKLYLIRRILSPRRAIVIIFLSCYSHKMDHFCKMRHDLKTSVFLKQLALQS